jgi:hypothetical protein
MANPSNVKSPESAYNDVELPQSAERLPPPDFTTFILSLSTSALVSLGEMPDADGKTGPIDLALARHNIDLIALLQEKSKGNLSGEEERLLDQVLLDLRLKFVDVARKGDGEAR